MITRVQSRILTNSFYDFRDFAENGQSDNNHFHENPGNHV